MNAVITPSNEQAIIYYMFDLWVRYTLKLKLNLLTVNLAFLGSSFSLHHYANVFPY